jgi:hypothetical protein
LLGGACNTASLGHHPEIAQVLEVERGHVLLLVLSCF